MLLGFSPLSNLVSQFTFSYLYQKHKKMLGLKLATDSRLVNIVESDIEENLRDHA